MRSYAQTTGVWLRGHLQNDYGVDIGRVRWVTFEDAHAAEFRDPPAVERAAAGENLKHGAVGGARRPAIYGAELPDDNGCRASFRIRAAAAGNGSEVRCRADQSHGGGDAGAGRSQSEMCPGGVSDVAAGKRAGGNPKPGGIDFHPFGFAACRPAVAMIIDYCVQQKLISRRFEVEELFDDMTRALGPEAASIGVGSDAWNLHAGACHRLFICLRNSGLRHGSM